MFHGMDVAQVRNHAERIRSGQQRLETTRSAIHARISGLLADWTGADAEAFQQAWESGAGAAWRSALDELDRFALMVDDEVDAQDEASQADGASPSGAAAPAGPGGGESPIPDEVGPDTPEVDPDVSAAWDNAEYADRGRVLYELVKEEFAQYGLPTPRMTWFQSDASRTAEYITMGRWHQGSYTISLNEWAVYDPRMLQTVAHEARHAAQFAAITPSEKDLSIVPQPGSMMWTRMLLHTQHGVAPKEFDQWRDDFQDYGTSEEIGREAYMAQPVEQDARRAEEEYNEGLTLAELQRLQRKAGVPVTEP